MRDIRRRAPSGRFFSLLVIGVYSTRRGVGTSDASSAVSIRTLPSVVMSPRPLTAILIFALGIRLVAAASDGASPKFNDSRTELAAQITRTVTEGSRTMAEATEAT